MNHFAEALATALDTSNSHPATLSKKVGLSPSEILQYCQGNELPEIKSLNQILGYFERADRLKLIAAYLQDHIPSEAVDVVNVETTDTQHVEVRIAHEAASKLPEDIHFAIANLNTETLVSANASPSR